MNISMCHTQTGSRRVSFGRESSSCLGGSSGRFLYKGLSIEAVLDRFPTAEIVSHDDRGWLIKAEVYGDGVDIWLRGQGDIIEVIGGGKEHDT